MKTNVANTVPARMTYEGSRAIQGTPLKDLRNLCLAALLFEDKFYEKGSKQAAKVAELVAKVATSKPEQIVSLAIECRNAMKLRHMPLFLIRELARVKGNGRLVAEALVHVIQRPDELTEYLALYFKDNPNQPLSAGSKRGLAAAFRKFNEYSLAKYDQDGAFKLRDVLKLVHAIPAPRGKAKFETDIKIDGQSKRLYRTDSDQAILWGKVISRTLETPDTWEVELSAGKDKKATFERLLKEDKLGGLALLRNLRNMAEAKVDESLVRAALEDTKKFEKVLPFRFISAAKYAPRFESSIETAMLGCLKGLQGFKGTTALVIDTSPSMWGATVSKKSEMDRFEAAAALAILIREICERVNVWCFNEKAYEIPDRHGFALRDSLAKTKDSYSYGGDGVEAANKRGYDRIIVLTDGEWHVRHSSRYSHYTAGRAVDVSPKPLTDKAYLINVGTYDNIVALEGPWHYISGWSERIIDYIQAIEQSND